MMGVFSVICQFSVLFLKLGFDILSVHQGKGGHSENENVARAAPKIGMKKIFGLILKSTQNKEKKSI